MRRCGHPSRLHFFVLAAALAAALAGGLAPVPAAAGEGASCALGRPDMSATAPAVDRGHIFCGDVRGDGAASGVHHRPGGESPESVRIGAVIERNPRTGVYVSDEVAVFDGRRWHAKRGISSFFPDACAPAEVVASIVHAATHAACTRDDGKWRGPSAPGPADGADVPGDGYCRGRDGSVLVLEGYWRGGARETVATAWPLVAPARSRACE